MVSIAWALSLLQVVPKAVAAAPDFKRLYDQLVETFDGHTSQQELKDAYAAATSDAADADADLQEIIERNRHH